MLRTEPTPGPRSGRDLPDILTGVRAGLDGVEDLLRESALAPGAPVLEAALAAILTSPAKRLRPAVALLVCDLLDAQADEAITLAAATEVLHTATLVHDDIVDGASERRGQPAIHVAWSEKVAVLAGDFLFATSADLVARLDRPRIVRLFADTIHRMSRSEFDAPDPAAEPDTAIEQYLTKIGNKTASLIALGCDAGADLAGASDAQRRALHEYGWSLGMAFQIADDVLDVSGEPELTGKPVGGDLDQGLLTLPVILYLKSSSDGDGIVRRLLAGEASSGELPVALRLVRESGAAADAMHMAGDYAAQSRAALEALPSGPARNALDELVTYAVERSR